MKYVYIYTIFLKCIPKKLQVKFFKKNKITP